MLVKLKRRAADAVPLCAAILAGLALVAPTTHAATFTVANLNDSGSGSLRDAIDQANRAPGADTITFNSGVTGTIVLSTGEIAIFDPLSVTGPGAGKLTISGNNASRIFRIGPTSPVAEAFDTALSGLTLSNGSSADEGGAVFVDDSNLTVTNCAFRSNVAQRGGGLYAFPTLTTTLTLTNTVFANNTATSDGGGFGAQDIDAVALTNVSATSNTAAKSGGGGYLRGVTVNISRSEFSNNTGSTIPPGLTGVSGGGGLRIDGSKATASIAISSTQFVGNTSQKGQGGALWVSALTPNSLPIVAIATLDRVQMLNNSADLGGGAMLARDVNMGLGNSTLAGNNSNQMGGGVAFDAAGSLTLTNATVSGNTSALANGGGIFSGSAAALTLASSTIAGNTANDGGGIRREGATATLRNSIVANNNAPTGPDASGAFSPTYSLVRNTSGASLAAGTGNLAAGTDPQLGPLAVNGGPTLTLLPAAGSAVVNAGDTNTAGLPSADQRGVNRISAGRIDMGAVERQSPEDVIFRGVFQ